ncbi:MAG TPA: type II toxin-antitoxin system Phd/YefM family antitoxin [Longimicrobium sp.]|nr:type II toxin-antitoxin system Phd/YefM family antitoxin [Longimicrobium sp.]
MSAYRVGVQEFAANVAEYVRRAEHAGESFTVTRAGQPVAVLAPVRGGVRMENLPELFASMPRLSEEEAEAFAADVASARAELDAESLRDPWAR